MATHLVINWLREVQYIYLYKYICAWMYGLCVAIGYVHLGTTLYSTPLPSFISFLCRTFTDKVTEGDW